VNFGSRRVENLPERAHTVCGCLRAKRPPVSHRIMVIFHNHSFVTSVILLVTRPNRSYIVLPATGDSRRWHGLLPAPGSHFGPRSGRTGISPETEPPGRIWVDQACSTTIRSRVGTPLTVRRIPRGFSSRNSSGSADSGNPW